MQISITRALAELKLLDKKINDAASRSMLVAVQRGTDDRATVDGSASLTVATVKEVTTTF